MEVQIAKRYPVAAPLAAAWSVLADVPAVAACMPGAQITAQRDATHYEGLVRSRIGPATLSFTGEITVEGLDVDAHRLRLLAQGSDPGGSTAQMQLTAHLEREGEGCVLVGQATVRVGGKLVQLGNRLLVPVADALLAQFAAKFNSAAQAAASAAQADVADAPPSPAPQPEPVALDGLALVWAVIRRWFAGLVSRRP